MARHRDGRPTAAAKKKAPARKVAKAARKVGAKVKTRARPVPPRGRKAAKRIGNVIKGRAGRKIVAPRGKAAGGKGRSH